MATDPAREGGDELAVRGAAYVESFVELIRDKAVRPIIAGARLVVLGLIGAVIAAVVALVVVLGLVRLLTHDAFGGRVWITDLIFGGIFLGAGTFLVWRGVRPKKVPK